MEKELQIAILDAIRDKMKEHDYFDEKFNTDPDFVKDLHHPDSYNKVYEVRKRTDGATRAVKKVSMKFDDNFKCGSSTSLTKRDGMFMKKFVHLLQESVVVEKYFSTNACIMTVHESWFQHTPGKGGTMTKVDIEILLKLVQRITDSHDTPIEKLKEKPSLLKFEGYSIFIEMELYSENLEKRLNNIASAEDGNGDTPDMVPPRDWLFVVRTIAIALEDVHSKGFIHFDVKPRNVFLDSGGRACLGDFGSARHRGTKPTFESYFGSTNFYNGDPIGPSGKEWFDIWSLGCLILRMFCKTADEFRKFFDDRPLSPRQCVSFGNDLETWKECGRLDEDAFFLIKKCLEHDLIKRWTAARVVEHIDHLTDERLN